MTTEMRFKPPPIPAGFYEIGGGNALQIHLMNRPNWFHRYMIKWAFGWIWRDKK